MSFILIKASETMMRSNAPVKTVHVALGCNHSIRFTSFFLLLFTVIKSLKWYYPFKLRRFVYFVG